MESQIGDIYKDVSDLGSLQGVCLPQRVAGNREGGEQSGVVETRIVRLIEPLKERRRILLASKEMHQVAQDLEDEIVSSSSPSNPACSLHFTYCFPLYILFSLCYAYPHTVTPPCYVLCLRVIRSIVEIDIQCAT